MRKCQSCGKTLSENAKFCPGCGTKYEQPRIPEHGPPQPEPTQGDTTPMPAPTDPPKNAQTPSGGIAPPVHLPAPSKKPVSKGKIILFSTLGAVVLAAGIAGVAVYRWYNSTEQQILRALDSEDYVAAIAIMKEDPAMDGNEALSDQLKDRISTVRSGFVDGSSEYLAAKQKLTQIGKLGVEDVSADLDEALTFIEALNQSRSDFATAEAFSSSGDHAEAIGYYQRVIEDDANYAAAMEKMSASVELYRTEKLEEASALAKQERYEEAAALMEAALKILPGDASFTTQQALYTTDHEEKMEADALASAASYADKGDLDKAIGVLKDTLSSLPSSTKLSEQLRHYLAERLEKRKADALTAAADHAENGRYPEALQALEAVMDEQTADIELTSAYEDYQEKYAAQLVAQADDALAEKDFRGAIAVLDQGLKDMPDNETLTQKLEDVKAKQPIPITTLLAVNSDDWGEWNSGTPTDPFGNDYSTACNYVIFHGYSLGLRMNEEHYAEYRLYGKYTTLTGTIATHINSPENRINRLQIYTDDELVYTSSDLGRKTDAIGFSVDVIGVEYVKIVVYTDSGAYAILSDVQLWP